MYIRTRDKRRRVCVCVCVFLCWCVRSLLPNSCLSVAKSMAVGPVSLLQMMCWWWWWWNCFLFTSAFSLRKSTFLVFFVCAETCESGESLSVNKFNLSWNLFFRCWYNVADGFRKSQKSLWWRCRNHTGSILGTKQRGGRSSHSSRTQPYGQRKPASLQTHW